MEMALFNVSDGFSEAVVRGYRSAFLTQEDYRRLSAADNLEGKRITEYEFLSPSP